MKSVIWNINYIYYANMIIDDTINMAISDTIP